MRWKNLTSVVLFMIFTALAGRAQDRSTPTLRYAPQSAQAGSTYGRVPLMFEANKGQTDPQVEFLCHGKGYSVFLTSGSLVLALRPSEVVSNSDASVTAALGPLGGGRSAIRQMEKTVRAKKSSPAVVTVSLIGASTHPEAVGEKPLQTKVNYFIGRDPKAWRTNVNTFAQVRYRNIYPGIDLVYYGNNGRVEYDFDLAPGADATKIQFAMNGADAVSVDATGNLVMTKGASELRFQTPNLYQVINGSRRPVPGAFMMRDATHVGFVVGSYDSTEPMVIDPVLVYSSFLGGSSDDFSIGAAVDSAGDAYMLGVTDSPDFPLATLGSYGSTQFRMFLAKFNPSGSSLIFADYFGGTSGDDEPSAVALDSSGNAYITGSTASSDFPVVNPYQSTLAGSVDAFLAQISADGSTLNYATYLGGSNLTSIGGSTTQLGTSVSVDPAGEVVVAGVTMATNFPTVNAFQPAASADQFGDWGEYGFVTKFAADGASLVYSTYLAGNTLNTSACTDCFPDSEVWDVATDGSGNAYVTGYTTTTNFPTTSGAFETTSPGYYLSDVGFVSKLTNSGSLAYSTYLGGSTSSFLDSIAVDGSGSAYVTGYDIANDNFPIVTTTICDPSTVACNGAVIVKLDPTGSTLVYSTFLGTSNNMDGQVIQVDANGDAFIVGSDVAFDLANPIEQYSGGGDAVLAEIDPTASTLLMATFLGGQGWELAGGLALDSNGAAYVTGGTQSLDFPVTQSAFQTAWGGEEDAFIAKIDPRTNAPAVSMGPFSLQFGSESVGSTSAPQITILRNMGSAALAISNTAMTGDFAETDDCGSTVAAASSCTFSITFTPTASGTRTGSLTVTDDATGSPHSVALSGTGMGASDSFSVDPSSLTFSPSVVGSTTSAQIVTITNTSSTPMSISGVRASHDFTATASGCSSVPASRTCRVQVSFTPRSAGTRTGTLQLTAAASGYSVSVALSGSGVDFVPSPSNTSTTVSAGGTASYQITVSSVGGKFSNPVNFACNGAPAFATCTVNPHTITPGSGSAVVTVAVKTSGPVAQLGEGSAGNRWLSASLLPGQLAIFGMLVVGARARRKFHAYIAIAVFSILLLLVACGAGGTGTAQTSSTANITPSGTYVLNVVATSGSLQHTTELTLVVQ